MTQLENETIDLKVGFGDGSEVTISISGYPSRFHVIKALENLGRYEYLQGLAQGIMSDEGWEDEEDEYEEVDE